MEYPTGPIEQRVDESHASLSTDILHSCRETDEAQLARGTPLSTDVSVLRNGCAGEFSTRPAATMASGDTFKTTVANSVAETRRLMIILHEEVLSALERAAERLRSSS